MLAVDLAQVGDFLGREIEVADMGGNEGFQEISQFRLIRRGEAGFGGAEKGFQPGVLG